MIYYLAPFDNEKQIGRSHNLHCACVPFSDDWICITDSDVLFLLPDTKKQISDILEKHQDMFQVYGCLTNRIYSPHQQADGFSENTDVLYHKKLAEKLQKERYFDVLETKKNVAGFLMIFRKKTWEKYKFSDNSIRFDSEFTDKVLNDGGKLGIMQGVYVFHDYRLGHSNPVFYTNHLR